ncbi:hypothetical protein V2W30_08150 [Streptomyces sp. Q6]|uniref:Uncharacterized protein n=1 Tax=Streptomyces citrinus TaxID=3118173 RepID=A0ACD5A7W8_9ACTN
MLRPNVMRAVLCGATMTAMAAFGTDAASAVGTDSLACHADGYVCMTVVDEYLPETMGVVEGQDFAFDAPTTVTSMSNDTTVTYCVDAEYDFSLPPGKSIEVTHSVNKLTVLAAGASCLI